MSSYVSVRATGGRVIFPVDDTMPCTAEGEIGSGLDEWCLG